MAGWLSSLFGRGEPQAPPVTIRRFGPEDVPLGQDVAVPAEGGWLLKMGEPGTVPLFEITGLDVERCLLTYRAALKSAGLEGRAFLEMWVRVPGRGESFSKGLDRPVSGTADWATYEIPFRLAKGQHADLVKLSLAVEGRGTVWIKDIELLKASL